MTFASRMDALAGRMIEKFGAETFTFAAPDGPASRDGQTYTPSSTSPVALTGALVPPSADTTINGRPVKDGRRIIWLQGSAVTFEMESGLTFTRERDGTKWTVGDVQRYDTQGQTPGIKIEAAKRRK